VARVVGVDGCRGGWVAVGLPGPEVIVRATLRAVLEAFGDAACVAVDIPIGLPAGPGGRSCDREARRLLGRASSRVFPAPTRACLEEPTYAAARLVEPSLSAQSYALRAKIREADEAQHDGPVVEAHPELAFLAFAGRSLVSKRTWDGQMQRRVALAREGLVLADELGPTGGTAAADDVLDAAACALVAQAVAAGTAERLGDPAEGVIWMPARAR
jgi:predicted RNase H-like nuclease